jgi:hypothetical protein
MRYVRLWAELDSTGLIDENGESIPREATTVGLPTWNELQAWVEDYAPIIPMNEHRRAQADSLISELDERGLTLLRKVRSAWKEDAKTGEPIHILYWSEGRLQYLDG